MGEDDDELEELDDEDVALLTLSGLRRQYSKSSTVHTAPFTFSTRMKHLCKLRLCRTAFCEQNKHRQTILE